MELAVRKSDLLKELSLLQGIVERKNTIPILANVLFNATKDYVSLLATDLDVGLRSRCDANVSKPGSLTLPAKKLYEIVKANGRIDILFANAGVAEFAPLGKITEEHFDKLFDINVKGTVFTVQKALPLMNDGGSIILNGSVASVKGTPAFGVYGATKAALRSLVRTWTSDLKDRHIRSNVISPGPTDTPAIDGQPADAIARIVSTIPMGRVGEPDEIAKAALFLASDDSSFVTGIELFVDGGRGQI